MEYYERLILDYPIYSIEDPLDEEDWDGWSRLTAKNWGESTACRRRSVCDQSGESRIGDSEKKQLIRC